MKQKKMGVHMQLLFGVLQVVMEYNFHWAGKQQMEMLMQPLPPTWGKFGHTLATWASSMFRCKVPLLPCPALHALSCCLICPLCRCSFAGLLAHMLVHCSWILPLSSLSAKDAVNDCSAVSVLLCCQVAVEDIIADGKLRLAVQPVFDETQLAAALQVELQNHDRTVISNK